METQPLDFWGGLFLIIRVLWPVTLAMVLLLIFRIWLVWRRFSKNRKAKQEEKQYKQDLLNAVKESKPETLKPACPTCQSSMKLRTVKSGEKQGKRYWVCTEYPTCRGLVAVDES